MTITTQSTSKLTLVELGAARADLDIKIDVWREF